MKFKNLVLFEIEEMADLTKENLEARLSERPLRECAEQEMETFGWIPVIDEAYVEEIGDVLFIRAGIERKKLSRNAIKTAVEKHARDNDLKIESRSEYKEIEEIVIDDMMRTAQAERYHVDAYIDLKKAWLVVDAASIKKASELTALLRKTIGSLPTSILAPNVMLNAHMDNWVKSKIPSTAIYLSDMVEMKELLKDEGGTARYKGIPADSMEILDNLENGWSVTRLGMVFQDAIGFNLTDDFLIKGIKYHGQYTEELSAKIGDESDVVAIKRSEAAFQSLAFRALIDELWRTIHGGGSIH